MKACINPRGSLKISALLMLVFIGFSMNAQPPSVTTYPVSNIGLNNAEGGGEVTNDMGYTVTARGVCWSTSPGPTLANNFTTDGSGMGVFASSLTGLTAGTTYYVRAYATNLMYGTGYGNELSFVTQSQFSPYGAGLLGLNASTADWGDYDSDGDLDLLLTGWDGGTRFSKIYANESEYTFVDQTGITLMPVHSGIGQWGDFDMDGDLDIYLSGDTGTSYASALYNNEGENTFTIVPGSGLPAIYYGSADWGDYDNDGDLDLVVTGLENGYPVSKIYRNDKNFVFTEQTGINLVPLYYSSVSWGDSDNDGDLDLLLSGTTDGSDNVAYLYINSGNNVFTQVEIFPGVKNSSCAWGDHDNDGDLDFAIAGTNGAVFLTKLFTNNGSNNFTEEISLFLEGVSGGSVTWGDYNNDGNMDLLLTGLGGAGPVAVVYRNNGAANFTLQSDILLPGVTGPAAWGDFDNDGDLDILLSGGGITEIFMNNITLANNPPSGPYPMGMNSLVAGNTVSLSFGGATDPETPSNAISYNLRVGTYPGGSDIVSANSLINGYLTTPGMGNMQLNAFFTLKNLLPGNYFWSSQAVDNGFLGSNWAEEKFFSIEGMIGFYPFNGNADDESGFDRNGTVSGASLATDRFGNSNSAFEFNGSDNFINLGNYHPPTNHFSVSAWINARSMTNNFIISDASGLTGFYMVLADSLYFIIENGPGTEYRTTYPFTPGELNDWMHITGTSSNDTITLYVDGQLVSRRTGVIPADGVVDLVVGYDISSNSHYFDGLIDDIRIYNSVLDQADVDSLYHAGNWPFTASISDTCGNIYQTVQIGDQIWMKENLRTTKYKDGTEIPLVTDSLEWTSLSTPAFCWYNNDSATYNDPYGILYNWFAINTSKLCPSGWHAPSLDEWNILLAYLGGAEIAASKLKEAGNIHWSLPNSDATNESGFTALPGGIRYVTWMFGYMGTNADFWTTTEYSINHAWYGNMDMNFASVENYHDEKRIGMSVRCIKDSLNQVIQPTVNTDSIVSITSSSAEIWASVLLDGGSAVTERGTCYSTLPNPTTADPRTIDGTGTGVFTSSLTGLVPGKTYYVRAYATNSAGTAYGNEISFTTPGLLAHYTLDGDGADLTGNGYDGVLTGTMTANDRFMNPVSALEFNGSSDFIDLTQNRILEVPVDFSAAAWIQVNQADFDYIFYSPSPLPPHILTNMSGEHAIIQYHYYDGASFQVLNSTKSFPLNEWTHIAVTRRQDTVRLFINGRKSDEFTGILAGDFSYSMLGGDGGMTPESSFDGKLDDARIYNMVLSDAEILQLYHNYYPPVILSAIPGNNQITLNWSASGIENVSKYYIFKDGLLSDSVVVSGLNDTTYTATGLNNLQGYSFRLSSKDIFGNESQLSEKLFRVPSSSIITDIEGNVYPTVVIGTQEWMAENLRVTKYNNGNFIPLVTDATEWDNLSSGAFSWYYNDPKQYRNIYGALYNYYAAIDGRLLCPAGWHVPSDSDWAGLESFLGGIDTAGAKLKIPGNEFWLDPNTGTNESGYNGLPAGYRGHEAGTGNPGTGTLAHWWTSTESNATLALDRYIGYNSSIISKDPVYKTYGMSIRCLNDIPSTLYLPQVTTGVISGISANTAISGGNIISDGGYPVVQRGICWGTATLPDTTGNKTLDGTGTGSFSSNMSGLSPLTTYYIRAYAVNNAGITYGNELSFTTNELLTASALITSDYNGSELSCSGASDGELTVTSIGGTGTISYVLNEIPLNTSGSGSGIFTGLSAGSYTVTVSDDYVNFITSAVSINDPPLLSVSGTVTSNYNGSEVSCNGANDGVLTVTASGGTGVLSFVLNEMPANVSGAVSGVFTGLPAGSYTVTVTDINGCSETTLAVVIDDPPNLIASAAITSNYNGSELSCFGNSNGVITVTASGGTGPLAYVLNELPANVTGAASGVFTGLPSGSYTVTVSDFNGCIETTVAVVIDDPVVLTASAAITSNYNGGEVSCFGASDGVITVTASGGTGVLSFALNEVPANVSGAVSGVFTGLPAGSYTVTVTDINGCSETTLAVVIDNPPLLIASAASTSNYNGSELSCFGNSNGVITVTASGGTGVLSFVLNEVPANVSGAVSGVFTGLPAGSYTVTVTDINGCNETTLAVVIDNPTLLIASAATTSNYNGSELSCFGNSNGVITVTASGGTGSLAYVLNELPLNVTGAASGIFTGLPAGSYTFTVTDLNGCNGTTPSVVIDNPPVLVASAAVTSNYSGYDLSNTGASDGEITITATGGTGMVQFNLVELPANTTGAGSGIFTGLPAGSYTFTVSDENGCNTVTAPVIIEDPPAGTIITDTCGNIYQTIQIGTQTWMKENLRTTKFNDGTPIPNVTDQVTWEGLVSPAYCWYYNDSATYSSLGGLYNWFAVESNILCPTGWHVPSDNEWKALEMHLGLTQPEADATLWRGADQGTLLKSTTGWNSGGNGDNSSGFNAFPSGYISNQGYFSGVTNWYGQWWTGTENSPGNNAWFRQLGYDEAGIYRQWEDIETGYSVRCLKDTVITTLLPTLTTQSISSITPVTATSGGDIISDGGAAVTERGVCWSTLSNPTISNNKTTEGTGAGSFTSSMTGLTPSTTYFVRAYATNSEGTGYGNEISFTTLPDGIYLMNNDSVIACSGLFYDSGGESGSYSGTENYTKTFYPAIPGNKVSITFDFFYVEDYFDKLFIYDGTNTSSPLISGTFYSGTNPLGTFTASSGNLSGALTFRFISDEGFNYDGWSAYISCSEGQAPRIITSDLSEISENSATCGGIIISDEGLPVTARGVCWSTSPDPLVSGNHTDEGIGSGTFISPLTGLLPGTLYYVRSYAINASGISYGEQKVFMTFSSVLASSDVSICSGEDAVISLSAYAGNVQWQNSPDGVNDWSNVTGGSGANSLDYNTGSLTETTYFRAELSQSGYLTAWSNIIKVTVNPLPPAPMISITGNILYSDAPEGNQWYDQDGLIPGAVNQHYIVSRNGKYYDIISLQGCRSDTSNNITKFFLCDAQFQYSWESEAVFTDLSEGNPTAWSWNFGDGTFSTLQNPTHTYSREGEYDVTLTIFNQAANCVSSVSHRIYAGSAIQCKADFEVSINSTTGIAEFTSNSTGVTNYYYDFGDGEFSIEQDPSHTYVRAGLYPVCLTVWNSSNNCQSVLCKDVLYAPENVTTIQADFSFFNDPASYQVTFNDLSSSNVSDWYWTMGDGKVSMEQDPVHTYSKPGLYNVCLTVLDKDNFLMKSLCKEVKVGEIPCNTGSDFGYFINPVERTVSFNNKSTGTVTDYFWTFGDGGSSALENPFHTYAQPGYYNVSLSVRNNANKCMDMSLQTLQVGSVDCRAGFSYAVDPVTYSVNFTDGSKGAISYYYWDFGNGYFSTLASPDIDYGNPGLFMVGQTVIDDLNGCMDYIVQPVQVGDIECAADFVSYVDSSTSTAYFTNRILGESTALLWSFGDGRYSTKENPVHPYTEEGIFRVGLNTFDFTTGCMDYYEEVLLISGLGIDCEADFSFVVDPDDGSVMFLNRSIGDITATVWNFGDGTANSSETDPVHSYARGGYYYVCLNVINSAKIPNMTCKWILIEGGSGAGCRSNFMFSVDSVNRKVTFVDNSYGNIDRYYWDFGDSRNDSVSEVKDPVHTYDTKGYYLVKHRVENTLSGCISNEYKLINVAELQVLKAAFGFEAKEPDKKIAGYPVDLVSASSGDGATVEWDFGDKQLKKGSFTVMDSTSGIVTHYYQRPGKYLVCLRVSDPVTRQSDTYCQMVTTKFGVGTEDAEFNGTSLTVHPNPFTDQTIITYEIPTSQIIELAVFDPLGRRIETIEKGRVNEGTYRINWESKLVNPGVYYLKLITEKGILTRQLVLSR